MFPIGYMWYFGTNLEERFSVPGFWPTQEQSHKIPYEKEEIRAEVERIRREIMERQTVQKKLEAENKLEEAKNAFRNPEGQQDSPITG